MIEAFAEMMRCAADGLTTSYDSGEPQYCHLEQTIGGISRLDPQGLRDGLASNAGPRLERPGTDGLSNVLVLPRNGSALRPPSMFPQIGTSPPTSLFLGTTRTSRDPGEAGPPNATGAPALGTFSLGFHSLANPSGPSPRQPGSVDVSNYAAETEFSILSKAWCLVPPRDAPRCAVRPGAPIRASLFCAWGCPPGPPT